MFDGVPPQETDEVRLLREARKYIARGWSIGTDARDAWGRGGVDPTSNAAVSWCLRGAVIAARIGLFNDGGPDTAPYLNQATNGIRRAGDDYIGWNDAVCLSQASALALMDRAIAIAVKEMIHV